MTTSDVIHQDPASWQAGYKAAMSDGMLGCPPKVPNALAYAIGCTEGKAARARATIAHAVERDAS